MIRRSEFYKRMTDYSSIQIEGQSDDVQSLYNTPKDLLRKSLFSIANQKEKELNNRFKEEKESKQIMNFKNLASNVSQGKKVMNRLKQMDDINSLQKIMIMR